MSPLPILELEDAITGVVDRVGPSVVTIATVQVARDAYMRPFPVEGVGSGVVVSSDGLIVTNHHVVRGARHAQVQLIDGRRFEAEYVGGDPEADLALLRVRGAALAAATLGDSDRLRVGQLAIAIGSPFGQMLDGPTVTVGVVSALRRNLQGPRGETIEGLVQTDAPINPGNSGGPLLDSSGQVIAINTAMIPHAQGIGFAVPVNRVRELIEQARNGDRPRRGPRLGISAVTLTPALAAQKRLPRGQGAVVFGVEPGSPAERARIKAGDIVRGLDGQPLAGVDDLRRRVQALEPGTLVAIEVERDGKRRRAEVLLDPATV